MLEVQKFILNNRIIWEGNLERPPYNLRIGRNDGYVILKYDQIDSDFNEPIVRESRGLILDEHNDYKVVCKAFDKFFNYGEELAAEINWDTAKIQEKVDGSIMKLWWSERFMKWIVSTNGTIYAQNADVMFPKNGITNFRDMFMEVYNKKEIRGEPQKDSTHVFELVGPQNRVVIPYEEIELYYLTSVNNETFEEFQDESFINFPVPLSYYFSSLEETVEFTKTDDFNTFRNEGFVVKDGNNNRIKIKTEDYLKIHRMRGETNPTPKRFLELLRMNEASEFLSYFPEYKEDYDEFKERYIRYRKNLDNLVDYYVTIKHLDRKDFASKAQKTIAPAFMFGLLDGKYSNPTGYLHDIHEKKLIEAIYSD